VEIQLERVKKRMEGREISISFTLELKKFIAEKGYDPSYGARPLKRAIQSQILDPLAQEIIAGHIKPEEIIMVDAKEGKVIVGKGVRRANGRRSVAMAAKS